VEVHLHAFLTSALNAGECSSSHSGRFTPGETTPGTNWIGSWVRPRVGLNAVARRKSPSPCRESNPGRPARSLVTILTEVAT
jgi:hypothetical protein